MQQLPQQQQEAHWRDRLIANSEVISDALEVAKAYAARFAEWVLIICLIANLVEMFPFFADWFGDVVLVVQAITLDIAGFGLATMGNHARRCGNDKAARTAGRMGWTLISLMILTVGLVTLSILVPGTKPVVDTIEKALILARVVVTVLYGHVVHSLRQASMDYVDELSTLRQEVSTLRVQVDRGQQTVDTLRGHLKQKQAELVGGQSMLSSLKLQLEAREQEVDTLRGQLGNKQQEVFTLQHHLDTLTTQVSRSEKQVTDLTSQLHQVTSSDQQHEVSTKRSQVNKHHRSEEVTAHEVNRSQGMVLQVVPKQGHGRYKHDPREVKAWCEAHADLSQAEQAAQLGISDAANLRRLLRRARDLEKQGQVANDE